MYFEVEIYNSNFSQSLSFLVTSVGHGQGGNLEADLDVFELLFW